MKFSELRKDRDYFTGKLSDIVRQLDLAGLAIIWIFRVGGNESGGMAYDKSLVWPMLFLVLSLGFDLLHYIWGSIATEYIFTGFDKLKTKDDDDVRFSKAWSFWMRFLFFWPKAAFTLVAYGCLAVFVLKRI
jgi:hypothetical protein